MSPARPFETTQRVYFDDLDALNVLHNVRYLLFLERARGEFFNHLGFRWQDSEEQNPDRWHLVAEHLIRFLVPVRGEGDVRVALAVKHLGTSSMTLSGRVLSLDGLTIHAENTTRLVRVDPSTSRPCPWSARMRGAIESLVILPMQPLTQWVIAP